MQVHRLLICRLALFLAAVVSLDPAGAQVFPEETFTQRQRPGKKRAIAISAVLPGLGQVALGSRFKGLGIFLGELTTLVVAVNANENYKTLKGRHEQETERYLALRHGGRTNRSDRVRKTIHVGYGPYWMQSQNMATMDEPPYITEATRARWSEEQRQLFRSWPEHWG